MAASRQVQVLVFLVSSLFIIHTTLGEIQCEHIPREMCAFAVASSGKRCALETDPAGSSSNKEVEYQCSTSEVVSEKMAGYVESDKCVRACGVDRKSVGISSDALLETQFVARVCSPDCYLNCPNIIDLFFNLALAEGVYLPDLCSSHRANSHRGMLEMSSSGGAYYMAASPTPAPTPAPAPAPAPAM